VLQNTVQDNIVVTDDGGRWDFGRGYSHIDYNHRGQKESRGDCYLAGYAALALPGIDGGYRTPKMRHQQNR